MPFIMQQQLHSPPGIMLHRFWSMVAETLSSQAQTTFIPPVHFLKVIVQRGTITTFIPPGVAPGVPIIPLGLDMGMPGTFIPARSIMIADVIPISFGFDSRVVHLRKAQQIRANHGGMRPTQLTRLLVVRPGDKIQRRIGWRA
jgi:hypothetical protein